MRVLMVHCRYLVRGGEEECFEAEQRLLRTAGIEVEAYEDNNSRLEELGRLRTALTTVWSRESYRALRERVRTGRFDLVHVHNFFPLISPAAYYAAGAGGAAVVQTLHNYRLMCPNALFFRDGRPCEDCLGRAVPWPGVVHACYRDSRAGTAAIAAMLAGHRLLGTFRDRVDAYIALNDFMRQKAIQGGLPAERIAVKPNFIEHDPGLGDAAGGYALFVARLSREKGIDVLLEAWKTLGRRIPLRIIGDGPLEDMVRAAVKTTPGIEWLGRRPLHEYYEALGHARLFIFTSTWYEGFPRTIMECFGRGVPIVTSAIGALTDIVRPGETGVHFRPGDPADLVRQIEGLLDRPEALERMRANARAEFEGRFTAEANLRQLLAIYEQALARRRQRAGALAAA